MNDTALESFTKRYESLGGHVHAAGNVESAAQAVLEIVRERSGTRVAMAGLEEHLAAAFGRVLAESGVEVLREPFASIKLPHGIDECQVGITGAAFGIAQSGTLAEVATNDAVRLVSGLPRAHIGVVKASEIVERFEDAAPRLRAIFNEHSGACTVSFISGPSRTGDIELILTMGVHGPEAAYVIVLDDAERRVPQ
ncbi:MAG: lactate utilization protein [Candidatus Hydrogenedentes bacterium]|nr:lactate utilization protein [Candidatus Hydrogenedentota bacterium]